MDTIKYDHAIFWDPLAQSPVVQLKEGILRRRYPLALVPTDGRDNVVYENEYVRLEGIWRELDAGCCTLSLRLTNRNDLSIRVTRLTFPAENGLDSFLQGLSLQETTFLRNGYQSWSTARSYHAADKPLRPWLQVVSQVSSNMANLPSNIPGMFSSELYAAISGEKGEDAFLVGQGSPFRQFFYIDFHLHPGEGRSSFFNLTYDFGRRLIRAGETIELDAMIFSRGPLRDVQEKYFKKIAEDMELRPPEKALRGYGTWYYYFEKIHPDQILSNLAELKRRKIDLSLFQIDDGYQTQVGDWLDLKEEFQGRMRGLADAIGEAGYMSGLWIAPFVAGRKSRLAGIHPDYLLKNEYGRKLIAGYNPTWPGSVYYGLDVTNPRYEEYLRKVIRTIVRDWGFKFLKCDFLFAGCLRSAIHYRMDLSRAEVLRYGMEVIRDEAGPDVLIEGCGMPLVPGIGTVDLMRVGPDTGPFWVKRTGKLLRTGAMMGVRNSIRNTFVRSPMHRKLWLNDGDCLMLRKNRTKLSKQERYSHINALVLSGGPLLISDDVTRFDDELWARYGTIAALNGECAAGDCLALDLMAREIPELIYNTAGCLGIFNMGERAAAKRADLSGVLPSGAWSLVDLWSGERLDLAPDRILSLPKIPAHGSRLFRVLPG